MIVDRTQERVDIEAALFQAKPKRSYNPFHYLWIAMEHVAYLAAPNNNCIYCWVWRMFFIGLFVGAELMFKFPWLKVW